MTIQFPVSAEGDAAVGALVRPCIGHDFVVEPFGRAEDSLVRIADEEAGGNGVEVEFFVFSLVAENPESLIHILGAAGGIVDTPQLIRRLGRVQ